MEWAIFTMQLVIVDLLHSDEKWMTSLQKCLKKKDEVKLKDIARQTTVKSQEKMQRKKTLHIAENGCNFYFDLFIFRKFYNAIGCGIFVS